MRHTRSHKQLQWIRLLLVWSVEILGEGFKVFIASSLNLDAVSAHITQWENVNGLLDAVFFDIDETLVIPATPFIYGLPKTDAYIKALRKHCPEGAWDKIQSEIEKLYYAAPHILVEKESVDLLKNFAARSHVIALTARDLKSDNTIPLLEDLHRFGILFSQPWVEGNLPGTSASVINASLNGETIGGIIFADGGNKGEIIMQYMKQHTHTSSRSALVDNSMKNCEDAVHVIGESSSMQHLSLHYTAAYGLDGETDDLDFWTDTIKETLGMADSECPLPANDSFQGDHQSQTLLFAISVIGLLLSVLGIFLIFFVRRNLHQRLRRSPSSASLPLTGS